VPQGPSSPINALISYLQRAVGGKYVRGATGQNGSWDCSGLVTAAYQQLGISLPPLTYSQVKYGQSVSTSDLQPGDLLFFNGDGGRDFGHVTIYIGGGKFIGAQSTSVGVIQGTVDPRRIQAVRRIMDGNGNLIKGDGLLAGHSANVPVVAAAAASGPIPQPLAPQDRAPNPPIPPTSSNQDIGSYLNHVATSATASGGAAPLQGSVDDIARQLYGYLASYLDDPEIGPILKQAASEQWDQARLAGAISKTQWWQHTGDSQRQWDAQEKTDPQTTRDKIAGQVSNLSAEASGLGVSLDDATLQKIARDSLREGWNDAQVRAAIGSEALKNPALISQTTLTKYKQMASDYGVNWSNDGLSYWVKQGIQNGNDNGFLDQVRAYSKQLYPTIAADIDKGITVSQYFDPYKQLAAQTLELNANDIDLSDPKWQRSIMALDPKTNERRPMTMYEWQQTLKTDPTYGWDKTKGGHDAATQMATGLAQIFGKTAA
jgi:hypothetical protein